MSDNKRPFKSRDGREIFYEYQGGEGTPLVFLNGLDDSMDVWKSTLQSWPVSQPRLFVDLIGQGASLQNELKKSDRLSYKVKAEEQGQILLELFASLKIKDRILVGNSYGGGVALWLSAQAPEQTEKLILINPFILRLDLSLPWARLWAFQYNFVRQLTPSTMQSPFRAAEHFYEKFIHNYMHFRFKNRIHNDELREISVELSQGMMEFNSFHILKNLPDRSVYLLFSENDTLVPRSLYYEFWLRLPPSKKRNCFQLAKGDHLMLEQSPEFVRDTLRDILRDHLEPQANIRTVSA